MVEISKFQQSKRKIEYREENVERQLGFLGVQEGEFGTSHCFSSTTFAIMTLFPNTITICFISIKEH